jgi:hypothetical protein
MCGLKTRTVAKGTREFIEKLDPGRKYWVLGAEVGGAWQWETFHGLGQRSRADFWIQRRYDESASVWMVLGDVSAPVRGHEVPTAAVVSSRFVAAWSKDELAFRTREAGEPLTIYRSRDGKTVAVWKLAGELSPQDAARQSGRRAGDCCVRGLAAMPHVHYIPLPGDRVPVDLGGAMVLMPHPRNSAVPQIIPATGGSVIPGRATQPAPSNSATIPQLVRGSNLMFNNLKWLWPNLLLANAFSLVGGEAGVGKSTVCATIAAAVTTGGRWPTGEEIEPGAVIYCEIEDDLPSVTGPALAAAGADMSRIDFCDRPFDLAGDISLLVAHVQALERDTGVKVRLIVLSPVRNFFGARESYVDSEVRSRLHRICEWAQANDVAILGILHPKQQTRDAFAGASAWKDVARAGIFCKWTGVKGGARHIEPLKTNSGKYGWKLPFAIEGAWPNGFESKRVVWGEGIDAGDAAPAAAEEVDDSGTVTGWLRGILSDGEWHEAAVVRRQAEEAGFKNVQAFYQARDVLGVEDEPTGKNNGRKWRLSGCLAV